MARSVLPFLMFEGAAEAAMRAYVDLFEDGEILELARHAAGEPGEGKVLKARIRLAGQTIACFDSPVAHAFTFTPSTSLFVDCDSEAEIERLYAALIEGGEALMPIGDYGFSRWFGWLNDRFGVSWQLNLP